MYLLHYLHYMLTCIEIMVNIFIIVR